MGQIAVVIIGIIVFLAFVSFADKQTDKDEEERRKRDDVE
jgi:hypothetical protein